MSKKPTKAADNVYCMARLRATKGNERLSSREGAAETTGIDRTRLAYIELGTINPHPEEVIILADTYNAHELMNWHCANQCPIGKQIITEIEIKEIFQLTLQMCATLTDVPFVKDDLLVILSDGIVSEEEKPRIDEILNILDNISKKTAALKMWFQKNT